MTYTVRVERAAGKAFDALPSTIKPRVAAAIDRLADNPRHIGVIKLAGTDNGYRVRVGRYRVVFAIDDAAALFVVPDKVSDTEPDSGQSDKAALYREAEQLQAQGLSWADIARRWNEQGWRTSTGVKFRGWHLQRDLQHWKKGEGE